MHLTTMARAQTVTAALIWGAETHQQRSGHAGNSCLLRCLYELAYH